MISNEEFSEIKIMKSQNSLIGDAGDMRGARGIIRRTWIGLFGKERKKLATGRFFI